MAASGGSEPVYPTQLHFTYGAKEGDETYNDPNITLNDIPVFDELFKDFSSVLESKYSLSADKQRYHNNAGPTYFARHLDHHVNAICLRIAWSVISRDTRAMLIAEEFAAVINRNINHTGNPDVPELKVKDVGYDGYTN